MSVNSYNAPIVTFVLSEIKCGQINRQLFYRRNTYTEEM